MEPIPSNDPELVRMNRAELVDLAPLGSVQITVFLVMLVAGIFQGYDNQALAYAATDFAKALGMTPAALAVAFTAGLFGIAVGAVLFGPTGRSYRSSGRLYSRCLDLGCVHSSHTFRKVRTSTVNLPIYPQGSGWEGFLRLSHRSSLSLPPCGSATRSERGRRAVFRSEAFLAG